MKALLQTVVWPPPRRSLTKGVVMGKGRRKAFRVKQVTVAPKPVQPLPPGVTRVGVRRRLESPTKFRSQSSPGTSDKSEKVAEDFRCWAWVVTFYRDYYEDEFLMSQIIGVLKDDTADVFDYTRWRGKSTKDLGVILQRMCNHYCDTLMFREQRNSVENMRQGTTESAADFLVQVSY